jgi:hypothetical protein
MEQLEIVIDQLMPKSSIRLIKEKDIIFIKKFKITCSTLGYKLNKSFIYNKLIKQLYMNDSLVILIINKKTLFESTIVISNSSIFYQILYNLDFYRYNFYFYGIDLQDLPIQECI